MKEETILRKLKASPEFMSYFNNLDERTKIKFEYVLHILRTEKVVSTKFVKKIINSDLYEMRVSVGTNEHRTMLFSMDHTNFMEATQILLLNAFLKKSEKEYNKQITIANNILNTIRDDKD